MSLSVLLWPACLGLALIAIVYLNWNSLQHIQRATDAESSYRAERHRVLTNYTKMRDGRVYLSQRYEESQAPIDTVRR